jgi:molybdenum cofactor biosynthesis enzyme MoaA
MADVKQEEPLSWLQPVYGEKPTAKSLEQFAVCKHCNQIRMNHSGEEEKCLFDASTFAVHRKPKK